MYHGAKNRGPVRWPQPALYRNLNKLSREMSSRTDQHIDRLSLLEPAISNGK
jgi:hypothetical protein